jgi:hypothetical protein
MMLLYTMSAYSMLKTLVLARFTNNGLEPAGVTRFAIFD